MDHEELSNNKISIYAVTANYIFTKCFENACIIKGGVFEKKLWPGKLKTKMRTGLKSHAEYTNDYWASYRENYLRDKYKEVANHINDNNPYTFVSFYHFNISPLLRYANVDDYLALNDSFAPVAAITDNPTDGIAPADNVKKIRVIYTPKPFGIGNIFRNTYEGWLYFNEDRYCEFKGQRHLIINATNEMEYKSHLMYGDETPLWIKVDYQADGQQKTAYFAEVEPGDDESILLGTQNIISCFNQLLVPQN